MTDDSNVTKTDDLAELRAELEHQRSEISLLRERLDETTGDDGAEARPLSRRRLLTGAAAAAVGGVAGAVLGSGPAGATTAAMFYGTLNDAGTDFTSLTSTSTSETLSLSNSAGHGLQSTTGSSVVNDAGVFGASSHATAATVFGVRGTAASTGTGSAGVIGEGLGGSGSTVGVKGTVLSATGIGVSGVAAGTGTGAVGSSTLGLGLRGTGGLAPLLLDPGAESTAPVSGTHSRGELYVASTGSLFLCTTGGTPGTWTQLDDQSAASGGLVALPAPSRVYDSRTGQPNPSGSPQGTLAFGAAARTINCSPAVPALATIILFNLTATGTAGASAGALLVWAAGASEPLASSINWSGAGQTIANAVTSACNGSQDVQVKCVASSGSSTNFILDVIGYYL